MSIQQIRAITGYNLREFSAALGIPYRTLQHWDAGTRECPEYVMQLLEYRVLHDASLRKIKE